jgi:hypothetical protein
MSMPVPTQSRLIQAIMCGSSNEGILGFTYSLWLLKCDLLNIEALEFQLGNHHVKFYIYMGCPCNLGML